MVAREMQRRGRKRHPLRGGLIREDEVPPVVHATLGPTHAKRIDTLVSDIVAHSDSGSIPGAIAISAEVNAAADALRDFL